MIYTSRTTFALPSSLPISSYPVHSARRRPLFPHGPGGRPARSDVAADAGLSRRADRQPARKAARDPARLGPLGDGAAERASRRASGVAVRLLRRSEEHTSELQSLMRISYAVFCLKK